MSVAGGALVLFEGCWMSTAVGCWAISEGCWMSTAAGWPLFAGFWIRTVPGGETGSGVVDAGVFSWAKRLPASKRKRISAPEHILSVFFKSSSPR
jgi:hypothetical protein